ncbi:MAG: NlpC/P60 family protein [Thermodesulfobacteriota bacterium]|nr:NlpC/P60 family protein [Thermodesulfobacteriota bacterium]
MKPCRLPGIPAVVFLLALFLMAGCSPRQIPSHNYHPLTKEKKLNRMGYAIQVGAFSKVENAARLVNCLNSDNLDAYYFLYHKGLYKVRFGSFESWELACREAEILRAMGIIDEFYIVRPDDYSITKKQEYGETYCRDEIVKTARNFIGVPYQWGGSSAEKGFDCSGLAMAVYRLNGLKLPRTSGEQHKTGAWVSRGKLAKGDLVFFDTRGSGKISHVGIYAGQDKFIHAPRTGKTVRISSLSNQYYKKRYAGARSYL